MMMNNREFALVLFAALTLTIAGSAFRAHPQGASKPKGKAAPKQEPPKEDKVFHIIDADKLSGGSRKWTLLGNVKVEIPEDNLLLFADRVELDEEAKVAKAMGKVRLARGEEMSLSSETLTVDINEDKAVCTNNVRMVYKSKPKPTEPQSHPNNGKNDNTPEVKVTTLTCERLEYDLTDKMATATGKLRIDYDNGNATAEKAIFLEADKLMTLEGKVSISVKGESNVALTMEKITINIETGELNGDKPRGRISVPRGEKKTEAKPPVAPEKK
jgi:lipopolysaccharide assembly outer membrane protein LptD (OstA)